MKNIVRRILFTLIFATLILAICAVCFVVGRGHSVYFDNKTTEDEKYRSYDAIDLYYNGEKVTTLAARERISISLTGQDLKVELHYRKAKNQPKTEAIATFKLPYDMDGIVINLPAYLEGAAEDVYLSEFVSTATTVDNGAVDETFSADEFGVTSIEE